LSSISTGFEFIFALVLMLGVLVTVHEFGHFIVAKWCGVRVVKFSIGFGPAIGIGRFRLAWQRGGTEYVIAWLPLGGFVKMLGELPTEDESPEVASDRSRSLGAQPVWKKLAIVFAGPAMNLLLPVVMLSGILWAGFERGTAVVGTVEPGSPAAAAGLLPGDRILSLDGEELQWWDELVGRLRAQPGQELALVTERAGERIPRTLAVVEREGVDLFRKQQAVGWTGLQHTRQKATLGVVSMSSPAARAGLRSGDQVMTLDGEPIEDWNAFAAAYQAHGSGGLLELEVERPLGPEPEAERAREVLQIPANGSLERLGVIPAVVLVSALEPGAPADLAGLEAGDLIVAVDGEPVGSFFTFHETVLASGGRPLEIQYARGGETRVVDVSPEKAMTGPEGMEEEVFRIGIHGINGILPGAQATDQVRGPRVVIRAAEMAWGLTTLYMEGLKRIVSGDISRKAIGGPIEIARQSHLALQAGWERFMNLLMLISINLGILNLLPIPILDGGQALMFTIEGVKRSPLSLRTREVVQQFGVLVLLALMGLAFWNDVTRHWSGFVDWLTSL
jgi:regulator of sigma E protease